MKGGEEMDFSSIDDLKEIEAKYPYPASGIYRADGDTYNVRVDIIPVASHLPHPGHTLHGTVPITPETEEYFKSKNWRRA